MNFLAGDRNKLDLDELRRVLIRLEDTIIFAMIERAQFPHNSIIYDKTAPEFASLQLEGAHPKRSFLEYLLFEIEQVHARVRRYTSPDERPFSDPASLPRPILPSLNYRMKVVDGPSINLNHTLLQTYIDKIAPKICAKSGNDDQNYGSAATRDVECLQALSRRIHYGIFIAEAKFLEDTTTYTRLIRARDDKGILKLLTNEAVEEKLLNRLRRKAELYGQDVQEGTNMGNSKISVETVVEIYRDYVIPLTKQIEVDYLLKRLDAPHQQ